MTGDPELARHFAEVLAASRLDAPRLAWAARKRDLGDEMRARLVEVQCERFALGASHRRAPSSLAREESFLLSACKDEVVAELEGIVDSAWIERGFVEEVSVAGPDVARRLAIIARRTPLRVARFSAGTSVEGMRDALARVRVPNVGVPPAMSVSAADWSRLFSPGSPVLEATGVECDMDGAGAAHAAIVAAAPFRSLRALSVGAHRDAGAMAGWLGSGCLSTLASLSVSTSDAVHVARALGRGGVTPISVRLRGLWSDEAVAVLVEGGGLRNAEDASIDLSRPDRAVEHLARAIGERVQSLTLHSLFGGSAEGLLSVELPRLRRLRLRGLSLGPRAETRLLDAPWFARLEWLQIEDGDLTPDAKKRLRKACKPGAVWFSGEGSTTRDR